MCSPSPCWGSGMGNGTTSRQAIPTNTYNFLHFSLVSNTQENRPTGLGHPSDSSLAPSTPSTSRNRKLTLRQHGMRENLIPTAPRTSTPHTTATQRLPLPRKHPNAHSTYNCTCHPPHTDTDYEVDVVMRESEVGKAPITIAVKPEDIPSFLNANMTFPKFINDRRKLIKILAICIRQLEKAVRHTPLPVTSDNDWPPVQTFATCTSKVGDLERGTLDQQPPLKHQQLPPHLSPLLRRLPTTPGPREFTTSSQSPHPNQYQPPLLPSSSKPAPISENVTSLLFHHTITAALL